MSGCPTDEVLEQFIDGRLGGAEGSSVEAHIGLCPACQRVLEELTPAPGRPTGSAGLGGTALEASALDRLKSRRPVVVRDKPAGPPDASSLAPPHADDDPGSTQASGRNANTPPIPTGPRVIAGFEILREVGRGGMGIVYEAIERAACSRSCGG